MSEQARTPGVSPLQEAVEKAAQEIFDQDVMEDRWEPTLTAILTNLWREAQVTALESVAKAGCGGCAGKWEGYSATPVQHVSTCEEGCHAPVTSIVHRKDENAVATCDRPEVHEALAQLRQSESAPRKENE